jgi:hypothetical protein
LAVIFGVAILASAQAQFKEGEAGGDKVGKSETSKWCVGVVVKASGGACRGLSGYAAIPMEWQEQEVSVFKEDTTPEVKLRYEKLGNDVKMLSFKINQLPGGQEAKALITFEVRRSQVIPPEKTDGFVVPDPKKLPREIRPYLQPSPMIESRDPKIRELAKTIGVDKKTAWEHVEAIYDWVWDHIKDKDGPAKGAIGALKDGMGDCEERSGLFIAICRAADIPARTVWVPGHCYSEFYLEDENGKGRWFPCNSRGTKEFGGISDLRPIFQKGDNVRPPRNGSKEHQRFLAESLTGTPTPGGGKPQVKFIRQAVK